MTQLIRIKHICNLYFIHSVLLHNYLEFHVLIYVYTLLHDTVQFSNRLLISIVYICAEARTGRNVKVNLVKSLRNSEPKDVMLVFCTNKTGPKQITTRTQGMNTRLKRRAGLR